LPNLPIRISGYLAYWAIIDLWKRYQDISKHHLIGVMTVTLHQEENVLIVVVHTIAKYKVCYYTRGITILFTFPPNFGMIYIF
jgi:hypothetical protein